MPNIRRIGERNSFTIFRFDYTPTTPLMLYARTKPVNRHYSYKSIYDVLTKHFSRFPLQIRKNIQLQLSIALIVSYTLRIY